MYHRHPQLRRCAQCSPRARHAVPTWFAGRSSGAAGSTPYQHIAVACSVCATSCGSGHGLTINGTPVAANAYRTTGTAQLDAAHVTSDGATVRSGFGPSGGHAVTVDWIAPVRATGTVASRQNKLMTTGF